MAESVLSSLVKTDKETKVNLEQINGTLDKMYKLQLKTAKDEATHRKRLEQKAKRSGGDRLGAAMGTKGKDKIDKNKKKGILEKIGDIFGGVIGGLTAAGLFKALGLAALGGIVIGYFKSEKFKKFVNDIILKPMWNAIKNGLVGERGIFGSENRKKTWEWIKNNPLKTLGIAATGMAALIGPKTALGLAFKSLSTIVPQVVTKLGALLGLKIGGTTLGVAAAGLLGAPLALAAGGGLVHRNIRERQGGGGDAGKFYADNEEEIGRLKASTKNRRGNKDGDLSDDDKKKMDALTNANKEILKSTKRMNEEIKKSRTFNKQRRRYDYDEDKKSKAEEAHQKRVEKIREKYRLQSGGPVRVPGSGSGDKIPMMLPSGSFVMNREASRFQNGGMVPTLLEPGEYVYGPGQWGAQHMMMNSAIPRFQNGGVVSFADHRDTGPGWSIGPDSQGRPSVFTKGAAEALIKAIKESNGLVKTSDITSSKRSPVKNEEVGGVANSNHLTGNAVDIHGTSKAWLKENGMKYGWKNLVYSGHDGHFDFTGQGGSPIPGDGKERTADTDSKEGGGNILSSTLKGIGIAGEYIKATVDVFREVFGAELSGLLGGMFGGGGSGGGSSSGNASSGAASISSPNAKALLNAIADAEGTSGFPGQGYRTMFTGKQFSGDWRHPRKIQSSSGYSSDAAGRYQFLSTTWDGMGMSDFSPASQDKAALKLASQAGVNINDGLSIKEIYKVGQKWASVEGGPSGVKGGSYGAQAKYSAEQFMKMYADYGGTIQRQSGGSVHMQSTASSSAMARQSENNFIDRMAQSMSPVVVPMPMGGGQTSVASAGAPTPPVPTLPANPNNTAALDLAFRLSMGASFA